MIRSSYPDDPLTYLPRKPVQEFARRRVIYDHQHQTDSLYVVMLGRVKIANVGEDGGQTIARIVCTEDLFGEACLIGDPRHSESATALDNVSVMSWTSAEIERHIDREPRLGLALSQYVVRTCIKLQDRIESMAVYKTPERVVLSLIQLAQTLGTPVGDGSIRIGALTHNTIAEFVGTSREIVTFQLNRLRRLGMLRYSRKFMDIHIDAMAGLLRTQNIEVPQGSRLLVRNAAG
jgi:CRP/FNR family transcriptional regulator, cyclic AMP receptor protein